MIDLEVDGVVYDGFTSASTSSSLDTVSTEFSFDATARPGDFPIKTGQEAVVLVNGIPVSTGFIEAIDISYDDASHSINVAGRSKTADLVDGTLGGKAEFNSNISLKAVAEKIIADMGASISVKQETDIEDFKKGEIVNAEPGQTAFEFIEKYARKRGVLLTTNGSGDLVITQSGKDIVPLVLQNIEGGPNNILSASVSYDTSTRFNEYVCLSEGNPVGLADSAETNKDIANREGKVTDDQIRRSRTFHIVAENSSDLGDASNRAIWEKNIRIAQGFTYNVTIQGHTIGETGDVWEKNKLIIVNDVFADIQEKLLINSVTFNISHDGGSTTDLEMVKPDVYTLQAERDLIESLSNTGGSSFNITDYTEEELNPL